MKPYAETDWNPIATAPRNATDIRVRMEDGSILEPAHWACDLSGEDQPAFRGWFIPVRDSRGTISCYRGIPEPTEWQPL